MNLLTIQHAAVIIRTGGVVAYPTEFCYGLGCDPSNALAVRRILAMKQRDFRKGLILISDHFSRLCPYIHRLPVTRRQEIMDSWPGPVTWLLPAHRHITRLIRGTHDTVAVRVSRHPVVRELCRESAMAIVSTSANRSMRIPHRSAESLSVDLGQEVDGIVAGDLGRSRYPSTIRSAQDGEIVRF